MPLFTDLPSFGYYYSGTVSPYANHSSLGGSYSRSPYSSYTGYSRGYSPLLSTISESRSGGISRINSPKHLHLHTSPKYRAPKPIRINTADIDVSANKYRRERPVAPIIPESHIVYGTSTPKSVPVNAPQQDGPFMPRADPHEDDVSNRSTIKRGRTVVRLSTMRSRSSGASDNSGGKTNWRREVAEDVSSKEEKKLRKTPGEKLIEKHLIRDKEAASASTPELEPEEEEIRECRSRAPSFHDICKDISSDKLYDDLNAGELRRIVERRKSEDKAMISPILEVPTEIVDVFKEDGTFHRRTTLKKLRKSTKAIFVPLPDTPVADQSIAFDINLNCENKQKDVKIPKITASVEVQNSAPTLRAVATEVEVETKSNKQKRKFFYKIVVEDVVIETKTKEDDVVLEKAPINVPNNNTEAEKPNANDVKIDEEDHNANNLYTVPVKQSKDPKLYTKVSNTSSKNLIKELQNEDKATNKIAKKPLQIENRASKVKAQDDDTDNFWNVIGSRESVYYNARRQRILEEQRNRLASEAIILEGSEINYNIDSPKAIEQTENIEQIDTNNKLIQKIKVDPISSNSKLLIKNKKNDVTHHVIETMSATKPAITPKVISQKECDKMASPVITPNLISQKEPSDKFALPTVTPKPTTQNQPKNKITSPVLEKRTATKDVLKKENASKSIESSKKSDNDIPTVPETTAPLKNSVAQTKPKSPEIQQEPVLKKIECTKIANKNLDNNLPASTKQLTITSPKPCDELDVKDNNLIKPSINKDDKTILTEAKSPDVQLEKDAANSKLRNKKYVKAKTHDLHKNDSKDVKNNLKPKMSIKGRKENEKKQADILKKPNSEIDYSKVRKSKSATHTEVEKENTIKAQSNPSSDLDLSENLHSIKAENVTSNEKTDITKDATKTPANVIKKPKPLLEKINTKLNEQVQAIESKFKKPLNPFIKSVKTSNDETKSVQLDLNLENNSTTIIPKDVENLQTPALKNEEQQSKLESAVNLQLEDKPPSEVVAQDLDTSKSIKSRKSRKSPSLINSARQSLKTFSERVTEKVRNPSLHLLKKPAEESKPKPALVSMNTSSDLTAITKEPITPIEKKCKLIPKNEPAAKPLIATPRPLQTVVRNRKAQQLHRSVSTDTDDSSDSSWTDSSDEESEFYECGSPLDNRDIAMDSLITTEPSYAYEQFLKTSRIIPPATKIPRFRKYGLDDFNFLKVLGKGSFGKVLLAELKNTEYYYAVKCLNKNIVLEDDDVECTLIERKVLALGTKHPYLCHLFCTFQTESHLFFVMEYLNGGDLMFHIQHSGRFPEPRAAFYAAEIVSGLRFLHKKGIVYRDLKLDNILLDFDGHVRIADFGMCKLQIYLDKTADTFCGTPDYMAPEIIKGLRYNQLVDWWSFGVLLYEMLIGQSPFSGCDEDELFWSICNEIPYYPKHLSNEALEILTRFLNKDSEVRLGSGTSPYGDVTEQRFFQDIDWGRLERRQLNPPFKPRVLHPLDTQYFDKAFTGEIARLTPIDEVVMRSMDQERFHGFSYTNPNATD